MKRRKTKRRVRNYLDGARVYLSGPMDFVASRAEEKKNGWRTRVGRFLRDMGCTVFDPWEKPEVRGLQEFGREGVNTDEIRKKWTFEDSRAGASQRSRLTGKFWETLHIDLRMVDTADFTIAYCPTNIYSVGTVHEIALSRQQRKPVLFVSPPVTFPNYEALVEHLAGDRAANKLLKALESELPIKPNEKGIPSLWYMPLVGGENFFDGFGFSRYSKRYGWKASPLDAREKEHKPQRALLPFLAKLAKRLPKKWDARRKDYVRNDDWLLWDLERLKRGAKITDARAARGSQ
jgi:hypothetical protein